MSESVVETEVAISRRERIFHALLFEAILVACGMAIMGALALGESLRLFLVSLLISLSAVIWNYIFNRLYDQVMGSDRLQRSFSQRAVHTLLFEGGIFILTTPILVFGLQLGWLEAFLLDIGFATVAVGLTFIYNWCFDLIRVRSIGPYPKNSPGL